MLMRAVAKRQEEMLIFLWLAWLPVRCCAACRGGRPEDIDIGSIDGEHAVRRLARSEEDSDCLASSSLLLRGRFCLTTTAATTPDADGHSRLLSRRVHPTVHFRELAPGTYIRGKHRPGEFFRDGARLLRMS